MSTKTQVKAKQQPAKKIQVNKPKKKTARQIRALERDKVFKTQPNIKKFYEDVNDRTSPAEGVRQNIMIVVDVVPKSIEGAPLSLMSRGYTRGWFRNTSSEMYWAYIALINDLTTIFAKQTTQLTGRASYLNEILHTYFPKDIPFKTGKLSYAWEGLKAVDANPVFVVRNYSFYMYDQTSSVNPAGWVIQVAPPSPGPGDDIYEVAAEIFSLLQGSNPITKYVDTGAKAVLTDKYSRDISGFASLSDYYGRGNSTASSASGTVEAEVRFVSPILANYAEYKKSAARVSRKIKLSSGDSTASYGLGYMKGMRLNTFNSAYPIIHKFIDIDEVVTLLCHYFVAAVNQMINSSPNINSGSAINSDIKAACVQLNCTAQQFRLIVRQQIVSMFSDTQALFQFQNYSNAPNAFEPLRVGSNCYGPGDNTKMLIPTLLNENLRALLPSIYSVPTKYYNDKNKQIVVPVWGVYPNVEAYNPMVTLLDEEGDTAYVPLFARPFNSDDPRMVDGVDSTGVVCDLNNSIYASYIVREWNDRISLLSSVGGSIAPIGGVGRGVLLTMTRFVEFDGNRKIRMKELSTLQKRKIPNVAVKQVKTGKISEDYFVPDDGSLMTQFTRAVTSLSVITETIKQNVQLFILPTIVSEPNNVPTLKEYRVNNLECNIIDIAKNESPTDSRYFEILNYASLCANGIAAKNNLEANSSVNTNNANSSGGFFADVFNFLGQLPI